MLEKRAVFMGRQTGHAKKPKGNNKVGEDMKNEQMKGRVG